MVPLALEEESEVGNQQDAAEESEEDPKWRKSDKIDKQYGKPEENGDELPKPKDHDIDSRRNPVLGGLKAPRLLIVLIAARIPPQSRKLPARNIFSVPKVSTKQYADNNEGGKILTRCQLKNEVSMILEGVQYDGSELECEEDEDNPELAIVVGLIEVVL